MKNKVIEAFQQIYKTSPSIIVRAPGRVNLIGEHTDYNQGFVFPMAIESQVLIAASPRTDDKIYLTAMDQNNRTCVFALNNIVKDDKELWSNYPKGIAFLLKERGYSFPAFNAVISGNIPMGAGLSSSAALLVAFAVLLQNLGNFSLDKIEVAKLCQQAENLFCGVQSGIMDQFIITLAQESHALFIDCQDLSYKHVSLPNNLTILISNTMKSRELSGSAYNECHAECNKAVELLAKFHQKNFLSLRDISLEQLKEAEKVLPNNLFQRAKHVISENLRVLEAVKACQHNDLTLLGQLINQSHKSLSLDYKVSSKELDLMVEISRRQVGVYGARLTGAGFGGCTVNLVATEFAQEIAKSIKDEYLQETGIAAEIYFATASAGASLLK
ncbi:MAG: galactokinase [Blastocatellia bacterium]|nr:galactokinase [Blastocatellia bacterium]